MRNLNLDSTRIGKIQEASMFDTCLINTTDNVLDAYNEAVSGSTSGSVIITCGVETKDGRRKYGEEESTIEYDVRIRFPLTTIISEDNTITVTKKNNTTVSTTYDIVSTISDAHGQLVALCKRLKV